MKDFLYVDKKLKKNHIVKVKEGLFRGHTRIIVKEKEKKQAFEIIDNRGNRFKRSWITAKTPYELWDVIERLVKRQGEVSLSIHFEEE
jgi:hypothetical protein